MLISDCPDEADIASGHLFSGEQGTLIDGMLGAIGLTRMDQRCASIAFTRPPTGRLSADNGAALSALMSHHVALVNPKILFLFGQQACQLLGAAQSVPNPPDQPIINHIASNVNVFATYHPRLLIERPQLKRHAWEVLKRMRGLI